jgi:hypothetical protein
VRVAYTLDADDLTAYYDRYAASVGRRRALLVLWLLGLPGTVVAVLAMLAVGSVFLYVVVLYALTFAPPGTDPHLLERLPLALVGVLNAAVLVVTAYLVFTGRLAKRAARRRLGLVRRQVRLGIKAGAVNTAWRYEVALGPGEVTQRGELSTAGPGGESQRYERRVPWSQVEAVEATAGHAFFVVRGSGWLVVPRSAFPDGAAFATFVAEARRLRAAAPLATAITAKPPAELSSPPGIRARPPGQDVG